VVSLWDVAIVGAGAAGLMTAITAARAGVKVLLLDAKDRIGAKILMSGGNRCNVTNFNVSEKDYESQNKRFVRNILRAFPSEKTIEFFKEIGVELMLEPGGKYFPVTHSARTVLDALIRETEKLGVTLQTGSAVTSIRPENGNFIVSTGNGAYRTKTVVVTTGGLSHPATGSDGSGYPIVKLLGHKLIPTFPALTPLMTEDGDWKSLAGISFNVRLALWVNQKKDISFEGGFLFTHFGFSGPTALNISRYWCDAKNSGQNPVITADFLPGKKGVRPLLQRGLTPFLPGEKEEEFRNHFSKSSEASPARMIKNYLSEKFPERFVSVLLKKSDIPENKILNQLRREDRDMLIRNVFHFPLPVTGVYGYQKAEVTAGGADLSEIDDKTMESKLKPGLFLAGEILDADGRIGGFNFQWAWSTGYLAGRSAAKKALEGERS